jgi:calcium-dependent protein kinase
MLLAINYMHANGIIHGDIKPENFLYESKDDPLIKLIDFGLGGVISAGQDSVDGTLSYASPEVLKGKRSLKSDIWSFGCVAYVLLCGKVPFDGAGTKILIERGQFDKKGKWLYATEEARDFIQRCLEVNPDKRMSAQEALQHAFIPLQRQLTTLDPATVRALCIFAELSKFKRACLSLLALSFTSEERSKVHEVFNELDEKKQGSIGLEHLKNTLRHSSTKVGEQDVDKVAETLVSEDGVMRYSEFLAATVVMRLESGINDDKYRATFRRFDTDNKGFLTEGDFTNMLGETVDEHEISRIFAEMNTSPDKKVSFEQFHSYLKKTFAVQASTAEREGLDISV